jgi:CYTH domain-containing protein
MSSGSVSKEVKIKYRLSQLPKELKNPAIIEQIYLDFSSNGDLKDEAVDLFGSLLETTFNWDEIKEVRIRKRVTLNNVEYFLTLKSNGTLERDEWEILITNLIYQHLSKYKQLGVIRKIRYEKALEHNRDLIIEVDQYSNNLDRLFIAEIEFDPKKYTPEVMFDLAVQNLGLDIIDVTEDTKYKNRNLISIKSLKELA